jgi:hypothetical protein
VRLGGLLGVEDYLRDAVAVAQVYEGQRPEVAAHRDPAHQHDGLPGVLRAQLPARVRALQLP